MDLHAYPPDGQSVGSGQPLAVAHVRLLAPQQVVRLVMEAVTHFCHSDAAPVEPLHVPKSPGLDDPTSVVVLREALDPAEFRGGDPFRELLDGVGQLGEGVDEGQLQEAGLGVGDGQLP